ncbi:MAG: hypothetical protein M3P82_06510, partial [Bacteroidota bacterium]|nr:hypothetical protein [Bacteroidota bacterium]
MIKILTQLLFVSVIFSHTHAQSISEKEIFRLDYKGTTDTYNFVRDSAGSNYCYFYRIDEENKTFIISGSSTSDKFDYASPEDVKFDLKGNYYAVTSNYKADYGIDNNFLIVNGKLVKNYDYIESYSSYINKAGEFVFVFKENDLFKLGYYNIENGFRESKGYENIRPVFKFVQAQYGREEESQGYGNADYFFNENGERAFIAIFNGKANIVFETGEIATDYSDINESSIILNRNNELSFIAKRGGRFFEKIGNEFVVSGAKEYDQFELAYIPLQFDKNNDPVYVAGDSITEANYNYYLVIGNQKQIAEFDNGKSRKPVRFSNFLYDINLNNDGTITYFGITDSMIPAKRKLPEEEAYD